MLSLHKNLTQPRHLEDREARQRDEEELHPVATVGRPRVAALEGLQDIAAKVVRVHRPEDAAAENKEKDKGAAESDLGPRERAAEADHAVRVVKVGEDAEDGRADFRQPEEEERVQVTAAGHHAAVRREHAEDVVDDVFGAVGPGDRVGQILDLVEEEDEGDAEAVGIVREEALLVARRGHHAGEDGVQRIGAARPAQAGANRAAQRIDTEVPGQNLPVPFASQQNVPVLVLRQHVPAQLLAADQEGDEEQAGAYARSDGWVGVVVRRRVVRAAPRAARKGLDGEEQPRERHR